MVSICYFGFSLCVCSYLFHRPASLFMPLQALFCTLWRFIAWKRRSKKLFGRGETSLNWTQWRFNTLGKQNCCWRTKSLQLNTFKLKSPTKQKEWNRRRWNWDTWRPKHPNLELFHPNLDSYKSIQDCWQIRPDFGDKYWKWKRLVLGLMIDGVGWGNGYCWLLSVYIL